MKATPNHKIDPNNLTECLDRVIQLNSEILSTPGIAPCIDAAMSQPALPDINVDSGIAAYDNYDRRSSANRINASG